MIYTIQIDDSTLVGKKLIEELRRHKKTVKFKTEEVKNVVSEDIPNGYISVTEFDEEFKTAIDKAYGKI